MSAAPPPYTEDPLAPLPPPLTFKEGVATLVILGAGVLAALGIALTLMIELFGNTVAQLTPGSAFQVTDGNLGLSFIEAGTIIGHPGNTEADMIPVALGPFSPGSVWISGADGITGLAPGEESTRLTLEHGMPVWKVPQVQVPYIFNTGNISPIHTSGPYFTGLVLNNLQIRVIEERLSTGSNPLWFIDFTITFPIQNQLTPASSSNLGLSLTVPAGYTLAALPNYAASGSGTMSSNTAVVSGNISCVTSAQYYPANNVIQWTIVDTSGGGPVLNRYLAGRMTLCVTLQSL